MPSARTPLRAAGRGHPWVRRLARRSPRDARRRRSRAPPRRAFSSGPSRPPPAGLLLRDFLHRALTDRASGYFAQPDAPVGRIRDPIDFSSLLGQEDYARALDARYARLSAQWLTPSRSSSPTTPARWLPTSSERTATPTRTNPFACTSSAAARARAPRTSSPTSETPPRTCTRACPTSPSRFPASSPTRSDAPFERSFETSRNVSTRPRLAPRGWNVHPITAQSAQSGGARRDGSRGMGRGGPRAVFRRRVGGAR